MLAFVPTTELPDALKSHRTDTDTRMAAQRFGAGESGLSPNGSRAFPVAVAVAAGFHRILSLTGELN